MKRSHKFFIYELKFCVEKNIAPKKKPNKRNRTCWVSEIKQTDNFLRLKQNMPNIRNRTYRVAETEHTEDHRTFKTKRNKFKKPTVPNLRDLTYQKILAFQTVYMEKIKETDNFSVEIRIVFVRCSGSGLYNRGANLYGGGGGVNNR